MIGVPQRYDEERKVVEQELLCLATTSALVVACDARRNRIRECLEPSLLSPHPPQSSLSESEHSGMATVTADELEMDQWTTVWLVMKMRLG